ncbi:MAG: Uma2 family endonuclease [Hyphomicrobiaceae bacterium]|nr:Uma2 family endonuclease [Hyphomicrobiaceae bacterium]
MNVHAPPRMTVEQFIDWAMAQPRGRYELYGGRVVQMSPERTEHNETKLEIAIALREAIKLSGKRCHVLTDGATVQTGERTAYEPDALVYCGEKLARGTIIIPEPVIVVEVSSPSSEARDAGVKLAGYFKLPSLVHYLIADPDNRLIVHHRRCENGNIATRVVESGEPVLEPPGLTVQLSDLFPAD